MFYHWHVFSIFFSIYENVFTNALNIFEEIFVSLLDLSFINQLDTHKEACHLHSIEECVTYREGRLVCSVIIIWDAFKSGPAFGLESGNRSSINLYNLILGQNCSSFYCSQDFFFWTKFYYTASVKVHDRRVICCQFYII